MEEMGEGIIKKKAPRSFRFTPFDLRAIKLSATKTLWPEYASFDALNQSQIKSRKKYGSWLGINTLPGIEIVPHYAVLRVRQAGLWTSQEVRGVCVVAGVRCNRTQMKPSGSHIVR